jgi:PAS domain S-box-containing protein
MNEVCVQPSAKVTAYSNTRKAIRVLHVDDEPSFLKTSKRCLEMEGPFQVATASSAEEAMERIRKETFDIIVSDYDMPNKDGLEFLKEFRQTGHDIPFVIFTGKGSEEVAIRALNLGADWYINKADDQLTVYGELARAIRQLADRKESQERLRKIVEHTTNIYYSHGMDHVLTYISPRVRDVLGYEPEEALTNWQNCLSDNPLNLKGIEFTQKAIDTGKQQPVYELELVRKDGSRAWVEVHESPVVQNGKTIAIVGALTDITERKRIEKALSDSERRLFDDCEKLRNVLAASPENITITDLNGIIADCNQASVDMHECSSKDELIGKNTLEFIAKKDRSTVTDAMRKTIDQGIVRDIPLALLTKNGREFPAEVSASILKDASNKPTGFVAIIRDITKGKESEDALRESEIKYRLLVEQSQKGIVIAQGSPLRLVFANPAMEKISGYTTDELTHITPKELHGLIHPEDRSMFFGRLKDRLEGKSPPPRYEFRAIRKDSTTLWLEISSNSVNYNRQPAVQAMFIDVTERKNAEQKLMESQQKFEALFKGNPEAAVYLSPDFKILDINPRFKEIFGYSLVEIEEKHLDDIVVPEGKIEEAGMLNDRAAQRYVYHNTVRRRKDESLVPVSISAAPINVEGRLIGYLGMYKDISELKKTERMLALMNEKLRVVGGLTRHDIQNKLSTMTGNVFLMKKKFADNSAILDNLKDIESASRQIERIFGFAKDYEMLGIEELTYIDVEQAVNEAISLFPNMRELTATNNCTGLTVLADSLLRQLFYNLIDNSLKYGQKVKCIKVSYEKRPDEQLRLIYEDDGVGVPTDVKPKIFKEGYTTGKGSGYGLYLIKKMIEVYGWTIQKTGEPGKGAVFTVTISRTNESGKANYKLPST